MSSGQEAVAALPDPSVFESGSAMASSHNPAVPLPGDGLSRVSSGEQVRLYVRLRIFDGVLKQGQKVPQDTIAQTLGVSRIPVREALIALEREGWVTIVTHRGVFVNAIDESAVRDHYELLGLMYGFGARRAAERQGAELARSLTPLQRRIAAADDNADEMFDANMA